MTILCEGLGLPKSCSFSCTIDSKKTKAFFKVYPKRKIAHSSKRSVILYKLIDQK